jgi:hypothetical protein
MALDGRGLMKRSLEYEVSDTGGLVVEFDDDPSAKYEVAIRPDDADVGDGVVITLNRRACLSLARLFAQLAEHQGHVHIGYTEDVAGGPGVRIVVDETGRCS